MAVSFPAALLEAFETAQHSIFRLEALPFYAGDPNYGRWVAGQPWEDTESKRSWCDLVRRRTSEGVAMRRVHLVAEPLSDYLRFELEWSYPPNIEAGEDVRIALLPTPGLRLLDFWLFDDRDLFGMQYDDQGELLRVVQMVESESLMMARDWRDRTSAASVPLEEYMTPA